MNIAIVGTGYVGLVSAACFADLGHTVVGIDINATKIATLQQGISPIYEPGLEEVLKRGLHSKRLRFSTNLEAELHTVDIVFCAVATPPKEDHSADLRAVFTVCETVAQHANKNLIFVNKSTVPVGTGKECETKIQAVLESRNSNVHIAVISNPEFLREGSAVRDTLNPDRIVVGINDNAWAVIMLDALYEPLTRTGKPLLHMSRESAELVKYASNAFLATKISFVNMLSELCEVSGANIKDIAKGMGLDDRIGSRFLQAGIGFGGSCFPKDIQALMAIGDAYHVPLPLVHAAHEVNIHQRRRFCNAIIQRIKPGSTVAVWGLSFKPKTDDMREAPSIDVIQALLQHNCIVRVFDPVAMANTKSLYPELPVLYSEDALSAARDADAVIVVTEWDEFRGIQLETLKQSMKGNVLCDGRNIYTREQATSAGFAYMGVGV